MSTCSHSAFFFLGLLARTRALASKQLRGPSKFAPAEFTEYPRGPRLVEEAAAALNDARLERMQIRIGAQDLRRLCPKSDAEGATLHVVKELARKWRHGYVRALVGARQHLAELSDMDARTLRDEARAAALSRAGRSHEWRDALTKGTLLVVVAPASGGRLRSVADDPATQLQMVAAAAADRGCSIVCLNPRLSLPSPVAHGRTMTPLILRDFERVYDVEADAAPIAGEDAGIAVYRRWPSADYRVFARRGEAFDLLGASPKRPNPDQLRALLALSGP